MEYDNIRVPHSDGHNGLRYEKWRNMMKTCLRAQGYDVWYSVVIGYTCSNKLKNATNKELNRNKKISMDFILEGLLDLVKYNVG
jgi:hypothetical protein